MNRKNKNIVKKQFSNSFGVMGYLFCFLQWLWAVLLYFSLIMDLALFMSPSSDVHDAVPVVIAPGAGVEYNPFEHIFLMVVSFLIVVFMLALTVYILIKIPSTIVKTSKKVVFETAEKTAPLVLQIQHKKETKKNRIKLTPRLVIIFKIILTLAPLILTFLSQFVGNKFISFDIAMIIGVWLTVISLATFILQYFCGRLLKVKMQDLI